LVVAEVARNSRNREAKIISLSQTCRMAKVRLCRMMLPGNISVVHQRHVVIQKPHETAHSAYI
jgi:hypothetical protein